MSPEEPVRRLLRCGFGMDAIDEQPALKEHPVRFAVFAFFLLLGEGSLSAADESYRGEGIRMVNGFPVVSTFINDMGPFRMLVDTGAVRCTVRPSVAVRVGLIAERKFLLATMLGEKTVPSARAHMRVGTREAPQTDVLINELPGLDTLDVHVDGLLGQSFLGSHPYLIDYSAARLWFSDEAIARAQGLRRQANIELWSGRPVVLVAVDSKAKPLHLILDSGVDSMVLRCGNECGALIDERTVRGVTNAGEMAVRKGRLPVAVIGSQKFFGMEAVLIAKSPDLNNAAGSVPLRWFQAIYVDPVRRLVRFAR